MKRRTLLRPTDIADVFEDLSYEQVKYYLRGMPHTDTHGMLEKHKLYDGIHIDAVRFAHQFRTKLGLRHNDASSLGYKMALDFTEHRNKIWTTINGIVIGVPSDET